MDRLRREERADTGDPAVGIHRKRLGGEIVVAVEDGEAVVLAQGTHILVAVNVVRGILDGVDDTVVIQPRNELLAQPAARSGTGCDRGSAGSRVRHGWPYNGRRLPPRSA